MLASEGQKRGAAPERNKTLLAQAVDNLRWAAEMKADDYHRTNVLALRRSFKSLTEWLEIPAGVVAQLMGHKPSATAEKHYTVRPLDLLRVHHEKIETWILEQAAPGALRVVNS